MRDMIAVLDGYRGLGDVRSPSGSNGANYQGGSSYPGDGFPIQFADRGLAGAAMALAQAGAPTGVYPEDDSWAQAWVPEGTNVRDSEGDYSSYLAAFRGTRTADVVSPSGSNGALYQGGGAYPGYGFPIQFADRGLAGDGGYGSRDLGYHMGAAETNFVPGGWATGQRSGGSDYWSGAPTYPSGEGGLSRLRTRAALMGVVSLGGDGSTAVAAARVVAQRGSFSGNPCDQAYQAAFQAALAAGYDRQWADSAGKRVKSRCMAMGYADFSTRA
jgi:hypothetical protein